MDEAMVNINDETFISGDPVVPGPPIPISNITDIIDAGKNNIVTSNTKNDVNKPLTVSYKGFTYLLDHVGKTYVEWRCQRSTQCYAMLRIGKYPNEYEINLRFDHNCQYSKNNKLVTVIKKSYPEDWTIVPRDLNTIVIYNTESGRKMVYYNGFKYSKKIGGENELDFKCSSPSSCKALLTLSHNGALDETNKIMRLEHTAHTCDLSKKKKRYLRDQRMKEVRKAKRGFVNVKVINYADNDQDVKALEPNFRPDDPTTIVKYLNERKNKMIHYKGYEYVWKNRKYICYKSARCKARLIVSLKKPAVVEFGKHTCSGNITSFIKSEVIDLASGTDKEVCPDNISKQLGSNNTLENRCGINNQLTLETKDEVCENETFYADSCCEDKNSSSDNTITLAASDVIDLASDADEATCSDDILKQLNTTDLNSDLKNQLSGTKCAVDKVETFHSNYVNYCNGFVASATATSYPVPILDSNAQECNNPSFKIIKFKDYSRKQDKKKGNVPKFDPAASNTVYVYLDKVNAKLQKLIHYQGYTYLDDGKKTLLYMCKSLSCSGALKISADKTGVCEVGTHNCNRNYMSDIKSSRSSITRSECTREAIILQRVPSIPDSQKSNIPELPGRVLRSDLPVSGSDSRSATKTAKNQSGKSVSVGRKYIEKRLKAPKTSGPKLSVPHFFKEGGKKYVRYENHIYVDKGKSYALYVCKNSPCSAAIKPYLNKEGFAYVGTHICVAASSAFNEQPIVIPDQSMSTIRQNCEVPNNMEANYFKEIKVDIDTDETINAQIKPDPEDIEVEIDDVNIGEAKASEQDNPTDFKIETEDCVLDDVPYIETQDNKIYVQQSLTTNSDNEQEEIPTNLEINSNNSDFQNYVPLAPNLLDQPCSEATGDIKSAATILPTIAEIIQVSSQVDFSSFAAANFLEQPYTGARQESTSAAYLLPTITTVNSISQPCREKKILPTSSSLDFSGSGVGGRQRGEKLSFLLPATKEVKFKPTKLKCFLEKEISYASVKELKELLELDDEDCVAIFREKSKRKLIYYQDHTYLADDKALSMCSNYACSAALKLYYSTTSVEVAELGIHNCFSSDNLNDETIRSSELVTSVESDSVVTTYNYEPNLEPKREDSNHGNTKSKGELLLVRRAVKTYKVDYDSKLKKAKRTRSVKIINHLVRTFVKVPLDEQTRYSKIYDKNLTLIKFRGFTHRRIRIDATDTNIISYMCVKFNELCDGSLLMADNKVIEYRDHFCEGKGSEDYEDISNNNNTLSIYYNVANACPELFYRGFKYWNTFWHKWKVPDGSHWVCSQAGCYVHLKINQNMVWHLNNHLCGIMPIDRKKTNVGSKEKTWSNSSPIHVTDEKGNSCLIYEGYIYCEMKSKETSELPWVCIKNSCPGQLRCRKGKVSPVSKHNCFEKETIGNINESRKTNNLAVGNSSTLPDSETYNVADDQNRSWHYVSDDEDKLFFYAPPMGKNKQVTRYILYKGYIYRFIPHSVKEFERWDCIYGGPNSICRGVLTCKEYIPVAVSNHACREERSGRMGIKNSNSEITVSDEDDIQEDSNLTQELEKEKAALDETDKDQHLKSVYEDNQSVDSIDIKEEGIRENLDEESLDNHMLLEALKPLMCDDVDYINKESNIADSIEILDSPEPLAARVTTDCKTKSRKRKNKTYFNIEKTAVYIQERHVKKTLNFDPSGFQPVDDVEANLPCTIIRSLNKSCVDVNNQIIEISDDET